MRFAPIHFKDARTMPLDTEISAQILEAVRRLVEERLIPAEAEVEETNAIPQPLVDAMKEMGLFGLSTPAEYGGLGFDLATEAEVMMELCRASVAFRSRLGTNNGIGALGINHRRRRRAEEPVVAAHRLGGVDHLLRPDRTRSRLRCGLPAQHGPADGSDFLINGTKRYITNAPIAGLFTVMARTDPDAPAGKGISAFLVPAETPGLSVGKSDRKMGQRGAHTADVVFEDVRVPRRCDHRRPGSRGSGLRDGDEGARSRAHPSRRRLCRRRDPPAGGGAELCHGAPTVRTGDRRFPARPGHAG